MKENSFKNVERVIEGFKDELLTELSELLNILHEKEEKEKVKVKKADMVKIALDLAQVLMASGDEIETIVGSPETEELINTIKQLVADLKAAA